MVEHFHGRAHQAHATAAIDFDRRAVTGAIEQGAVRGQDGLDGSGLVAAEVALAVALGSARPVSAAADWLDRLRWPPT